MSAEEAVEFCVVEETERVEEAEGEAEWVEETGREADWRTVEGVTVGLLVEGVARGS